MPPSKSSRGLSEVVEIGGQQLLRVKDERTGEFVFRPVDAKTGKAKTKETIDKEKREAHLERNKEQFFEKDMQRWEREREKAIVDKRFKEASKLRWEEKERKEKLGISAPTQTKTTTRMGGGGSSAKTTKGEKKKKLSEKKQKKKKEWLDKHGRVPLPKPSKELVELREEMKLAKTNNWEKVNAGKFSFLKMALELEEGKFQTATREARERNYEFERKAKNVRNGAMEGTDSEDESEQDRMRQRDANDPDFRRNMDAPIVKRGSDVDLLDPDYRREVMPSSSPPPPAAAQTQNKKKPQKKPQQNKKPPKQLQQPQQKQRPQQNGIAPKKTLPKPKLENLTLNG